MGDVLTVQVSANASEKEKGDCAADFLVLGAALPVSQ